MIETEIQKLTAAVSQLTVTAEALLETLRHRAPASGGYVIAPVASMEMQPPAEEPAPAPKPKKVKAPKAEAPAPAPVVEEVTAEPDATPDTAPASAVEKVYTIADLREAAQKALDAGKLDGVVNLNKEYGVKRISEVPADLYGEIITKLEKLVNG